MTRTSSNRACFICDQQECPYLRSHTEFFVAKNAKELQRKSGFRDSSLAEYDDYFYNPCDRCDHPAARGAPDRPLCLNCQHLRLQHFFICSRENSWSALGLKLPLGTYQQIQEGRQQSCELCTLVYNSVEVLRVSTSYLHDEKKDLKGSSNAYLYRGNTDNMTQMRVVWDWDYPANLFDISLGFAISPSGPWIWDGPASSDEQGIGMRAAGSRVPWDVVRRWLFECDDEHQPTTLESPHSSEQLPPGLMVIDVEAGRIIDAPPDCSYIALSYVWGKPRVGELSAQAAAMPSLRASGSLRKDTLPATIWDAMTVCQELGVQYLWVDRLCIIQDSDAHKTQQIRAMDVIYSRATLTICALGSQDSHTGLWGTAGTPRAIVQGHARIGDLEIMQRLMDDRQWRLGHAWWKRAWTYQEYLLSRRRLLFSPWQVTFECDHAIGVEGFTNVSWITPESQLLESQHSRLKKYDDIVQEYNDREFTFADDIYAAFQGVFKHLYGSLDQYVWGLPATDFDNALLWRVESLEYVYNKYNEGRMNGIPRRTQRGVHLASWSWVNRSGRTNLESHLPEVLASVARWTVWDDVRGLQPVVNDGLDWNHKQDATIHAWAAWSSGCIETPIPADLAISSGLVPLREKLLRQWPKYQDYWREAFATPATWITPEEVALVKARTGRILLRTTVASLQIGTIDERKRNHEYRIRDHARRAIGKISEITLSPTFAPDPAGEQWDFVAISVAASSPNLTRESEEIFLGQACDFKPLPQNEK